MKTRTYRSELRQQQAEQTRSRVVAAAAELFANDGYARTTLAKIAAAAGVSTETVQGQGPKAALLIAAAEFVGVGVSGEENLLNLEIGRELIALDDPGAALDLVASMATDVHQRTAQLAPALFGGASTDPELDRYLNEFFAGIKGQVRRVLDVFLERGWLRDDVPFRRTRRDRYGALQRRDLPADGARRQVERGRLPGMVAAHARRDRFPCASMRTNPARACAVVRR